MQTMDASLAGLVRAGKITMATAESRSSQPAEMRRLVQGIARADAADGGCLMGAAVFTYKAVDGAGVPSKGEVKGDVQGRRHRGAARRRA